MLKGIPCTRRMTSFLLKVVLYSTFLAVINCEESLSSKILKDVQGMRERRTAKDDFHYASNIVCYQQVSCFSLNAAFGKAIQALPQSPEKVGTRFLLFSRNNREEPQTLDYLDPDSLTTTFFSNSRNTVFIIHGLEDVGLSGSRIAMKNAFLKNADCQVVIIDWQEGARAAYSIAAANSELVGRQTGALLFQLKKHRGLDPQKVHLVGFSLGAHAVGFTGKRMKSEGNLTVARITALDPAWPLFNDSGPSIHVWKDDATFVDVIHTSAGRNLIYGELGMVAALGHVDFYPNGGSEQPGCPQHHPDCSHLRAETLFTESIGNNNCTFTSFPCDGGKEAFSRGECTKCESGGCGLMGFLSQAAPGRGKHFLSTNDKSPYCKA